MIPIHITTALLIYLGLFLLLCFGAWSLSHIRQRRKEILPPVYRLSTCEYCQFSYLVPTEKKISKCPQCNSYNE